MQPHRYGIGRGDVLEAAVRALVLCFILLFTGSIFPTGCERRSEPAPVSTAVGHVAPKADGTLPKVKFLTAPFQTIEVDNQRSTTYLMSTIAFLVAAVAVFLAIQVPVLTKSMWALALVAVGYGMFTATYATYYTYIVCGFFILMCLAVILGLILIAKHVVAGKSASTLADEYEKIASKLDPKAVIQAKGRAMETQAKAGITRLVKKIRGK